MGQYYTAVNLDKKQYLRPHACGDGAKLLEFGLSAMGTMSCLALLLADGNGRGGGDLFGGKCLECKGRGSFGDFGGDDYRICEVCRGAGSVPAPEIVGSWAGDRIVITGDYADEGKLLPEGANPEHNLYTHVYEDDSGFEDVSLEAMRALVCDSYVRQSFEKSAKENPWVAEKLKQILAP